MEINDPVSIPSSRCDGDLGGDVRTGERCLGDGDHEDESKAACGTGSSQLDRSSQLDLGAHSKKRGGRNKTTRQRLGLPKTKFKKSGSTSYITADTRNFCSLCLQFTGTRFVSKKEEESERGSGDVNNEVEGDSHRTANLLFPHRWWKSNSSIYSHDADLNSAKDYHRRHRAFEFHTKCRNVVIAGKAFRFCQQCSRFHALSEFDDAKRSCRRRLPGHNARRQKAAIANFKARLIGLPPRQSFAYPRAPKTSLKVAHSESDVRSRCTESESYDTDKKMKIKGSPEYQKREALESAALQMRETAEPELEHFSLEVNKDTAPGEVHSYPSEQQSEVNSYCSGPEYKVADEKVKTEASLEYHQIMHIPKMQKESSPHGILDDSNASIDMLVSGAKQERRPQGCGAINYDSIFDSESGIGSHCSESESEDTKKKIKIEASPKYHKRADSAPLQMRDTAEPDLEHFSLGVIKDTAPEEVHLSCSEQPSEVDSYCSGPGYEFGDRKVKTEASLEYHEIMCIPKMQKESSPHATLDDNDASIDTLVGGAKQERKPQGCGAINYDSIVNHLIKSIGKSNSTKIGIYGKNEVGKATVVEPLKESTILRNLFDRVICVSVPLNCDRDEVHSEMARQISSDLAEANAVDMQHSVVNALEGLKFLLILVGINQPMKLETMRIPDPTPPIGSKIVFVTGSGQLCDEVEVDTKICLDNLLSWELFCQNVGEVVHSTEVQDLAREIVMMCRHNSHAVILMARALQNVDDILIWKHALERLTVRPASHEAGMEALVVNVLRFSIDQLEHDKTRRCLKNVALCYNYQEIAYDSAISLWVRDGIVDTHDEGQKVLKILVNANLLEVDENGQFVKFQDLDQHILVNLIFQPEESRVFLMRGGLDMMEPPEVEEWESAKEICLMHTGISELPEEPKCPSLSSLFLQRNYKLRKLPSSFFNQMPALEVLNLSRTRIRSLPESISQLVSLKRLFLNDCVLLRSISPAIGRLKQLEVFDLEGTKIINLPKEIECLINLNCLGISISGTEPSDDSKTVIPHGLITALQNLEELNLDVDPDAEWWDTCAEGIVSEVCNLKRLSTIKFSFPRLELLRQFYQLRKSIGHPSLAQFRFLIGNHANRIMNWLPSDIAFELERCKRYLRYINGDGVFTDIKDILQQSDALFLERHANLKTLSELGINIMEQLKWCVLGECNELEVLVDASDTLHQEALTESHSKSICLESLEFLYVYYMRNLRNIWKGSVWKGSLTSLKLLTLRKCPELTVIFSHEMLDNLNNLEEVTIEDCPAIKSLFNCENSNRKVLETSYFLPMLKKLSLHYLPELSSISCGLQIAPRLERLSFYDCPSLKSLSTAEVSGEHLKKIRGERSWWKDLEWHGHKPDRLDSIFVPIDSCDIP